MLSLMVTGDLLEGREMASKINLIKDGLLGKRWQTDKAVVITQTKK